MWQKPFNSEILTAKDGEDDILSLKLFRWLRLGFCRKKFILEDQDRKYTTRDSGICYVKDRSEKTKLSPPQIGNQLGKTPSSIMGK